MGEAVRAFEVTREPGRWVGGWLGWLEFSCLVGVVGVHLSGWGGWSPAVWLGWLESSCLGSGWIGLAPSPQALLLKEGRCAQVFDILNFPPLRPQSLARLACR